MLAGGASAESRMKCQCCGQDLKDLKAHFRERPSCKPAWWDAVGRVEFTAEEDVVETLGREFLTDDLQDTIAWDLSEARYSLGHKTETVQFYKRTMNKWLKILFADQYEFMKPLLQPGVTRAQFAAKTPVNLFAGIESPRRERAFAMRNLPYAPPILQQLAPGRDPNDTVARCPLVTFLVRKLKHDTSFRKLCIEQSEKWKVGDKFCVVPKDEDEITDMSDGVATRFSELLRPGTSNEIHDLRLGFIFNCDEVEVRGPQPSPLHARTHTHTHTGVTHGAVPAAIGCGLQPGTPHPTPPHPPPAHHTHTHIR